MCRMPHYCPEIADEICVRIAEGEPLRKICHDLHMPSWQAVYQWIEKDEGFARRIARARDLGFDAIAERIYRFDEVRTVYLMSGSFDLLVIIEGKSLKDVANFVATRLATIEGVTQTRSHFMLKPYKKDGVIINDEERDRRLVVTP